MGRNIIENVLHTTSQESVLKSHTWVFFTITFLRYGSILLLFKLRWIETAFPQPSLHLSLKPSRVTFFGDPLTTTCLGLALQRRQE